MNIEEIKHRYEYLFKITDKNGDGLIEINEAVDLFRKSGLPSEKLKIIWDLSGINSTTLQKNQFFIALSLIAKAQNGKPLQINDEVSVPSFDGIIYPQYEPDWTIPPTQLSTYESYFEKADTEKTGAISGQVAKELFIKSGLSNQILADIWTLSDLDSDGKLNLTEFSIAMHLINMCLKGFEVPKVLPNALLSSLNMKEANLKNKSKISVERHDSLGDIKSSYSQFNNSFQGDYLLMNNNENNELNEENLLKQRLEEENRIQEQRKFESLRREEEERKIKEQRKNELLKLQEEQRQEELRKLELMRQQELKRQEEEKMRLEEMRKQEALRKQKELEDMKNEILVMIKEKLDITNELRSIQNKKFLLASQLATMEQEGEAIRNEVGALELEIEKIKIKGANIREKITLFTSQLETLQEQKEQMESMAEERQRIIREEEKKILVLESQVNKNKEAYEFQKKNIEKMKEELLNLKRKKERTNSQAKIDRNINMKSTQNFPFPDFGEKKDVEESSSTIDEDTHSNSNPFKTSKTKMVSEHAFLDDFGSSVKERGSVIFRKLPDIISKEKDQFGKVMAND